MPNWPWPKKEGFHLIGGLLCHVCQHDLFKCVQNWTNQMCDMESSNGWMFMVLFSFNGWTQIVQVPVFKHIRQTRQSCMTHKSREFNRCLFCTISKPKVDHNIPLARGIISQLCQKEFRKTLNCHLYYTLTKNFYLSRIGLRGTLALNFKILLTSIQRSKEKISLEYR